MRPRTVGVLGFVVVMALGGLAAASYTQPGESTSTPSFTVPVGRIGDEVEYIGRWTDWQAEDGSTSQDEFSYTYGLRVTGIEEVPDETLLVHDALSIQYTWNLTQAESFYYYDNAFYDLETRDYLQYKYYWTIEAPSEDRIATGAEALIGPLAEELYDQAYLSPWYAAHVGENRSVMYQGRTLFLGQDLSGEENGGQMLREIESPRLDRSAVIEPRTYDYQSQVTDHALLHGQEVFGISQKLTLEYVFSWPSSLEGNPGIPATTWVDTTETRTWFDPENPWPIRIERSYVREGGVPTPPQDVVRNYSLVIDQVRYEPGTTPIPWGECDAEAHYRSENTEAERSGPGASHPADGASTRLRYPLSSALAHVGTNPLLTGFQDWSSRHPERTLIGFSFHPWFTARDGASGLQGYDGWDLVFGFPNGEGSEEQAYVVSTWRNASSGLVVDRDWGPEKLGDNLDFDMGSLPANPVTISAAIEIWEGLVPDDVARRGPNTVSWGYTAWIVPESSDDPVYVRGRHQNFGELWVEDDVVERGVQGTPPGLAERWEINLVIVDAQSGNVGFASTWENFYPFVPHVLKQAIGWNPIPTPLEADGRATSSGDAGALAALAIASSSLLAAVLFGYFFPLLRYLGVHAWIAVAGYSKLSRSTLLENQTRDDLLSLIRTEPGSSPPELHKRLGGGWSTIVYHLGVLEKNSLVSSLVDGRHKRFFPTDTVDWSKRGKIAALRNPNTRRVYEAITGEPGLVQSALAHRMGHARATAQWHVERLAAAGLVASEKRGHRLHYYAQPVGTSYDAGRAVEVT